MTMRIRDLTIHEGLSIVRVEGFEPEPDIAVDPETGEEHDATPIDPPGSANWLCGRYGMSFGNFTGPGILYPDYDGWGSGTGRDFQVLISADEAQALVDFATAAGYTHDSTIEVSEPMVFGDGNGTVTILKHHEGWLVLES